MFEGLLIDSSWRTCLIGLLIGLGVYWMMRRRKYNYPPGPTSLPLIGHLLQIKSMDTLHEQAYEWSKKYGPVITINLGPTPVVFVNTIQTALEVLVKKTTDFANRPKQLTIDLFTSGGKDIAFGQYGPTWHFQRKLASKALRQYMQGENLNYRVHAAMETVVVELSKQTGVFDPEKYVNFIVAHILTGLCFGGKYQFGDREVLRILEIDDEINSISDAVILEDYLPFMRHIYKSKTYKKLEDSGLEMLAWITDKYQTGKKQFDRNHCRHLLDNLLLAKLEAEEEEKNNKRTEPLTEDHLIQTLNDIFLAGVDTSRMTIRFAILHMCAYPDIQAKVQEELDNVVGRSRFPGLEDRPNLSYTEAVLHESMRVGTVAPTGLFHVSTCDTEISGYKIPKGTQVAINHWALHHDAEAWSDVNKFVPERYLGDNGKLGPKPQNWLPFSAGKRVCLGEFVAKPELHLIFAILMQQFKWSIEPGTTADLIPGGNAFTLVPKPYKVVIERRVDTS